MARLLDRDAFKIMYSQYKIHPLYLFHRRSTVPTAGHSFYRSVKRVAGLPVSRILPGHHALSAPLDLLERIEAAFRSILEHNKLYIGAGVFPFGDFQIHL
jgi:hypothetical protein